MQLRNTRTGDVITVHGVVADTYADRPLWEPVSPEDSADQVDADTVEPDPEPDHTTPTDQQESE
jgi:hypothetical protein